LTWFSTFGVPVGEGKRPPLPKLTVPPPLLVSSVTALFAPMLSILVGLFTLTVPSALLIWRPVPLVAPGCWAGTRSADVTHFPSATT
jgi:hypothetical protein